jgi:FKBP-type peptidyl-prolyl cis-trans isomerase FkpA
LLAAGFAAQLAHRLRTPIINPYKKGRFMQKLVITAAAILVAVSLQARAAESKEEKTASGIGITMLKEGAGASPKASDTVKVHYRGTLQSGEEFDSSYKRGQPAAFPLTRVIPCWTEGVQKLKVGGKAKLVCPPELAYGNRNIPGIPANSTLIFEVELLDIAK